MTIIFLHTTFSWSQDIPKHAPNLLPGVEEQMLTADYWIALQDDADVEIMSWEEIGKFNGIVRTKSMDLHEAYGRPDPNEKPLTQLMGYNLRMNPIDPLELSSTITGDSLRTDRKSVV